MIDILHRLRRDRRGVAALELALVLPVMLVLFFGSVEVTQLIRVSNKLNIAAQSIESMVAGHTSILQADVDNAYNGGKLIMAPFSATLSVQVVSVTFDANAKASGVSWQVVEPITATPTPISNKTACTMVAGLGLGNDSVILVQASYSYGAVVHYVLPASFNLSHVAYGRPRNVQAVLGLSIKSGSC